MPRILPASISAAVLAVAASAHAQTLIRISQETLDASGAGRGDFDANVRAVVATWDRSTQTPGTVYSYGSPVALSWNGNLLDGFGGLVADRTHMMFALCAPATALRCTPNAVQGVMLVWVHDRPGNPDGGSAKTIVRVVGSSTTPCNAVRDDPTADDPGDLWSDDQSVPGERTFLASNAWGPRHTDGYTIGQLNGPWRLEARFADWPGSNAAYGVLGGLTSWVVYGADGVSAPLSLEVNRRVEARPLAPCEVVAWPSKLVLCPAGPATMHVSVAGTGPFTYQWRRNGTPLAGATGADLTITNATVADNGVYTVVVSGPCGTLASSTVTASLCRTDYESCPGAIDPADIAHFVQLWLASLQGHTLAGDFDGNGAVEPADVAFFVATWFATVSSGC